MHIPQIQLQAISMGIPLTRASTTLPATAIVPIFNIVGGRVLMTSLVGEATVLWGAVAGNTVLNENPTNGTTTVIGSAIDYSNLPLGATIGITGLDASAMIPAATGGIPGFTNQGRVLRVGVIEWQQTGTAVGEMSWALTYIPLDDGAYMTVA